MKQWGRTPKIRRKDLNVRLRGTEECFNVDLRQDNRSERHYAKRALRQALNINNMV